MNEVLDRCLAGKRVLVLDGEQRSALATVRSLGRRGVHVEVGEGRPSMAAASRFSRRAHHFPRGTPAQFVTRLREVLRDGAFDAFVPCTDATLRQVYSAESPLATPMPYPRDPAKYLRLSDKYEVTRFAEVEGIAVPRQIVVHQQDEIDDAISQLRAWPVVVKPARSVAMAGDRSTVDRAGVRYAESATDLRCIAKDVPESLWPLLLQERIVGPGIGVFLFRHEGKILARFAHRRLREKPPSGGVSVYRESIAYPDVLGAAAERLLAALDWDGPAMIECKVDASTGLPYIMEINGRFWGSLQLGIDAGVDFPAIAIAAVLGQSSPAGPPYLAGVRSRWWLGDVDHLMIRLRGRTDADLPPDAPDLVHVVLDFMRLWRAGDHSEVLRWSDPKPAWRELKDWLARR